MKRNLQPEIAAAIDTRLDDVVSKVNYRITLNNQIQLARLKADKELTFSTNGGIFKITPTLISFVQTLIQLGQDEAILMDSNSNPIEISDLESFQSDLLSKYTEAMNGFHLEFKSIRQKRTTASLLGE